MFSGDHARRWHELYQRDRVSAEEYFFRQRRDLVVDYVRRVAGPSTAIVDLGCGAGPVLCALREAGLDCVGIDCAPDMLAAARARLREAGLSDDGIHEGDCRETPFADQAFDIVVCLGVIAYVEDYAPLLREIDRILKPGGTVLISCRNVWRPRFSDPVAGAKALARRVLGRGDAPFFPGRFLDPRVVEGQLRDLGWSVEQFVGIGHGPLAVAGHPILGDGAAIRLSDALASLTRRVGLGRAAARVADVSLWRVTKPRRGAAS